MKKIIWNYGEIQSPAEAMMLLQATLDYIFKVLADEDLEKECQLQLRSLQKAVTELRYTLESERDVANPMH